MEVFKNSSLSLLITILTFSLFTLSLSLPFFFPYPTYPYPYPYPYAPKNIPTPQSPSPSPSRPDRKFNLSPSPSPDPPPAAVPTGRWVLLRRSIGISAMHMQLLHSNEVVIFDRTDFGPSNLTIPPGKKCRLNDDRIRPDCTAHSVLYDVVTNTFRPLYVQTDVWCSSGAVGPDGTLIQTGGFRAGDHKIRLFRPCEDDSCDWVELVQNLSVQRWYASNHILPDGNVIIVGGRRAFSYEFFPKNPNANSSISDVYYLPFLRETSDIQEENNLYPFLHLLPDGNLYIFANQRSISFDYVRNRVVREFPAIPGEKRSYPSTGSSVLLPLVLSNDDGAISPEVEVMICGGAKGGAFLRAEEDHVYEAASKSCGRMKLTDPEPRWEMEDMPMGRVMPDMLLLPTGDVLILNGAANGTAGWENGRNPVFDPVLYDPDERKFSVLTPSTIPRMYHSSAILLPDGSILVGGSNPHVYYEFTGVDYPTDLSLEGFLPPYMDPQYGYLRPLILSMEDGAGEVLSYGQQFSITFTMTFSDADERIMVTMMTPSFTTHSFSMNQRMLILEIFGVEQLSAFVYRVTVFSPWSRNVAPPGYYMLFVVHDGIPGQSVWVKLT